ncbi:MAG: hypothetical protein Ct9H300mP20_10880 [Gammaproteobacteria bacterium]|nr:MAG: hypothetical protein Ct9H300mP20_10880 [Gammaproteobacteria bacterium]
MKLPIYLDYASTTPVDPRVVAKMQECLSLEGNYGNPASRSHEFGWKAEGKLLKKPGQMLLLWLIAITER